MIKKKPRALIRAKKHKRLRFHLAGTADKPRLSVFRSNKHMYVQIIDDNAGNTLVAASTVEKDVAKDLKNTDDTAAAEALGSIVAKRALDKGIETVVFDRAGFIYAGKIKALADSAREAGLKF